jgi:hypothetical protein
MPYTPEQQREAWARAEALRAPWRARGWTVAGGMWGEAAWLRIAPDLVVSISDDTMGIPDPSGVRRVNLWIYRPPFYPGWRITHGEAPSGCDERFPNAELVRFDTEAEALAAVDALRAGGGA